ncbi:hypothetical protein K443DRAFT_13283 [Laccaria amethystina LaAM-08-1]|uniref:Uncharacterized protein n=1 Tax=Laccaria amethystina LaAM-08-1 TaxID=1095629 RepID=A0A0C9WIF7_9AGAR|nr:hypothetical protein K443DRAFT_13283 [Laccaria amethystina LaAM-08-1]
MLFRRHLHFRERRRAAELSQDNIEATSPLFLVVKLCNSVIKLRIAPKLALLPATTAVWKATSLGTVPKKPKPSHATSAVKKAISPAIAPITQRQIRLGEEEAVPVVVVVAAEAPSAINAARSDTSRVRAPSRLRVEEEEDMEEEVVVDMEEVVEEEVTERLVVVHRRLATLAVVDTSAGIALSPRSGLVILAGLKATSLVTARGQQRPPDSEDVP